MKLDPRVIGGLAVVSIIIGASLTFAVSVPYGGGGEIGSSLSRVDVRNAGLRNTWYPQGQHEWPNVEQYSDLDGNFEDHDWGAPTVPVSAFDGTFEEDIQLPGVKISVGYPYYLEYLGEYQDRPFYTQSEEAVVEKEYEKTYTVENETQVFHYELINYGIDVTLRTDADSYYKTTEDFGLLGEWGWNFERRAVEAWTRINFGLSPWVPVGAWNGSYSIVDGWVGILQAQVYENDNGVFVNEQLEEDMEELKGEGVAVYETDTFIDGMEITFNALNMYLPDSDDTYQEVDFENSEALVNVKNAVNIEMSAKLGAGAAYIADFFSHWTNIVVQNVFVTYRIVVKLATTVNLRFITEGDPVTLPGSGSSLGDPPPVPVITPLQASWSEFWADVGEWLMSPAGIFYMILIVAVIIIVAYVVLKIFVRRGG